MSDVPEANFNISRTLVYEDPFLNYTGELAANIAESFACSLNYGTKSRKPITRPHGLVQRVECWAGRGTSEASLRVGEPREI